MICVTSNNRNCRFLGSKMAQSHQTFKDATYNPNNLKNNLLGINYTSLEEAAMVLAYI